MVRVWFKVSDKVTASNTASHKIKPFSKGVWGLSLKVDNKVAYIGYCLINVTCLPSVT